MDLREVHPHHTFSWGCIPLTEDSQSWALLFTMEKHGAVDGLWREFSHTEQKFSRPNSSPPLYVVASTLLCLLHVSHPECDRDKR